MTTTTTRVGGPLLGDRSPFSKPVGFTVKPEEDVVSWNTLEPLLTPPLSASDETFVLLPNQTFVTAISFKTGNRVACFIPQLEVEGEKDVVVIESACIATYSAQESAPQSALHERKKDTDAQEETKEQNGEQHVLIVGCSDGTLCEFDLGVLVADRRPKSSAKMSCGAYDIPGPCFRPRRVFSTKSHPIKHLMAPSGVDLPSGVLLYAMSEDKPMKSDKSKPKPPLSKVHGYLQRIILPRYSAEEKKTTALYEGDSKHKPKIQDKFQSPVGYDKEGEYHNNVPFSLCSISKRVDQHLNEPSHDIFVLVAQATCINIYYERISTQNPKEVMQSISFPIAPENPLSAATLAPNGTDITCGYMNGDIRVMSNALPQIVTYMHAKQQYKKEGKGSKPDHPRKRILSRHFHWHAHAVTSLAYQNVSSAVVEPMLYSGGYESVLATWQLSRGTYKPAHVLPRLAKGGIVHILCATAEKILVYCQDNSLQLFESHNFSLLWKVQGLASLATNDSVGNTLSQSLIRADGNSLILSGLAGAPGYLHWYDVRRERVNSQLEVAPFNRVSRTETNDSAMPVPSVTNCVFGQGGQVLVTIDTTPSENSSIGASERLADGNAIGVVTTLRFWAAIKGRRSPYALTAAMAYPHGQDNRVSAVAVSKDGQYACTVSNDEGAFRMWHQVEMEEEDDDDKKSRRTPVWTCRYKVSTPSGYANFGVRSSAIDFSADGSILAIAYGNMITLWNHKESTLLTSLLHLQDDKAPVESLSFVKTNYLHDLILTRSRTGVTLQSPFGQRADNWSLALPLVCKNAVISHAELIPSRDLVAVCITFPKKATSHILLVDAVTGTSKVQLHGAGKGKSRPVVWQVPGVVQSLGVQDKLEEINKWMPAKKAKPIRLYVTLKSGDMLLLQSDDSASTELKAVDAGKVALRGDIAATDAPKLHMIKRGEGKRKHESVEKDAPAAKRSMFGASLNDDGTESAPLPSSELPSLGSSFTRAFLGRNLARNKHTKDDGN